MADNNTIVILAGLGIGAYYFLVYKKTPVVVVDNYGCNDAGKCVAGIGTLPAGCNNTCVVPPANEYPVFLTVGMRVYTTNSMTGNPDYGAIVELSTTVEVGKTMYRIRYDNGISSHFIYRYLIYYVSG